MTWPVLWSDPAAEHRCWSVCLLLRAVSACGHTLPWEITGVVAPCTTPRQADRHTPTIPLCCFTQLTKGTNTELQQKYAWASTCIDTLIVLLADVNAWTCSDMANLCSFWLETLNVLGSNSEQPNDCLHLQTIWDRCNLIWCIPEFQIHFPAMQNHRWPPERLFQWTPLPAPTNKLLIGVFTHDITVPEPGPLAGSCTWKKARLPRAQPLWFLNI